VPLAVGCSQVTDGRAGLIRLPWLPQVHIYEPTLSAHVTSSDTPQGVCLQVFGSMDHPQVSHQVRCTRSSPDMPTNCGSPVWAADETRSSGRSLNAKVPHQQIAGLLGDPGSGRVRGDAQQMHAASGMLDDEQNIEPVPQQRVDAQEVRGQNAVCLGAQEFSPARPVAARCRIDTGPLHNRPHRAGRKPVAQASKFTVDSPVSPGRILRR
jgi:hypothetical protein